MNLKIQKTILHRLQTDMAQAILKREGLSIADVVEAVAQYNSIEVPTKLNHIKGVCEQGICARSFALEYPPDAWAVLEWPIIKRLCEKMSEEDFISWGRSTDPFEVWLAFDPLGVEAQGAKEANSEVQTSKSPTHHASPTKH